MIDIIPDKAGSAIAIFTNSGCVREELVLVSGEALASSKKTKCSSIAMDFCLFMSIHEAGRE